MQFTQALTSSQQLKHWAGGGAGAQLVKQCRAALKLTRSNWWAVGRAQAAVRRRAAVTCMQTGNHVFGAVPTEAPEQTARVAERRRAAGSAGCAAGLLRAPEPAAAVRHVRDYKQRTQLSRHQASRSEAVRQCASCGTEASVGLLLAYGRAYSRADRRARTESPTRAFWLIWRLHSMRPRRILCTSLPDVLQDALEARALLNSCSSRLHAI